MGNELKQFAPIVRESGDVIYYPGVTGWGLQTDGFRIVMYGPAEHYHPYVKAVINGEKFTGDTKGVIVPEEDTVHRKYTSKKRQDRCISAGEHEPCHIHVIDIKSGHETRFELVEHYSVDKHLAKHLYLAEKRKNSLNDDQIKAVEPILNKLVPDFVQCWREIYQDNQLNGHVSRIESVRDNDMIERRLSDGRLAYYNIKSNYADVIPKSEKAHKSLGDRSGRRDR